MRSILFLVDFYYPKPMPNGICTKRVAEALINLGYEVHVLSYRRPNENYNEVQQGVFVHRINMSLVVKLHEYGKNNIDNFSGKISILIAGVLRKIQKFIFLPWFPLSSPLSVYRYYRRSKDLHEKYNFESVIAVFLPVETLYAGLFLKNKIKTLQYGVYVLDSLIYLGGDNYIPGWLKNRLSWKFEKMVYETADKVYNMDCHRRHHTAAKYNFYRNKINFLDSPLFVPRRSALSKSLYDKNKKHLVYTGSLYKEYRNSDYLCKLFLKINQSNKYQLHFYTRGTCEEDLLRYEKETGGTIQRHGFVSHNEIDNIMANADYLINIGVSNSTAISSKIFDFMSTGKPIIHLYYLDDDVNLIYFNRYKLSLAIKMAESLLTDNAKRLQEFLLKTCGETIEPDTLDQAFRENTPMYTAMYFDQLARGDHLNN